VNKDGITKKPVKKYCEVDACKKKPIKRNSAKKHWRPGDLLIKTGKTMGGVTVDFIMTSGEMAKHPGKSAYVVMTSSGEVIGEVPGDILRSGELVVEKTKDGFVLVKGSGELVMNMSKGGLEKVKGGAEKVSGADKAASREEYIKRLCYFFGPFVSLFVIYILYFVLFPWDDAVKMLLYAMGYLVTVIPGFDKNTLILGAESIFGLGKYQMAINIWLLDSILGIFLCLNFDYVKKIPFLGKLVENFEKEGVRILKKYSWIRRFSLVGLLFFIVLPFQGSGGLAGSIVGRMIGMKPMKVIIAVVSGTLLGCLTIAALAGLITKYFPVYLQYGIPIAIAVLMVFAVGFTYYRKKQKEKDLHYQLYIKPVEEAELDKEMNANASD